MEIVNLELILSTIASMIENLCQILSPVDFLSHSSATIVLRSPMPTGMIAHRHATCAAELSGTSGSVDFGTLQPPRLVLVFAYTPNVVYHLLTRTGLCHHQLAKARRQFDTHQIKTRLPTWRSQIPVAVDVVGARLLGGRGAHCRAGCRTTSDAFGVAVAHSWPSRWHPVLQSHVWLARISGEPTSLRT